jgi:Predicted small molecule binding protein (contains 3H domain)
MNSKERRDYILSKLVSGNEPLKGHVIAAEIGVTRQVIVKDIAILRAEGKNIIATPEGYLIPKSNIPKVKRVIAVCHKTEDMEEELETIVKYGGVIKDVIVEHPLYGEMKGMLMLKTLNDVQKFMSRFYEGKVEPLSRLTGGVHIHTIEAEDEVVMENILNELREKKFLISD